MTSFDVASIVCLLDPWVQVIVLVCYQNLTWRPWRGGRLVLGKTLTEPAAGE